MKKHNKFEAIVVGSSAGGINALSVILSKLPKNFRLPILVVQHVKEDPDNNLASFFHDKCNMNVLEADDKLPIQASTIYIAPAGYHLLVEQDYHCTLSIDERVCFSRPSIDVLFESASDAYQDKLVGIILTGANMDGSNGLKYIKQNNGLIIVQDPKTAESAYMPKSAIETVTNVDHILSLNKIYSLLLEINGSYE